MINCMIAGVGGQGTVLASKLIAAAAMRKGFDVRTTETIGMAQRGGSVVSHIRMGHHIHSPLIPLASADVIIAFEPAEAVRLLPYLAGGGQMIVCDTAIKPFIGTNAENTYQASVMTDYLKAHVARLTMIDGDALLAQCGNAKTLNIAILGAAMQSGAFPFEADDLTCVMKEMLQQRFWEINLASFEIGRSMSYAK